jgi:hypothetical protein
MHYLIDVPLNTNPAQLLSLQSLQKAFAAVCNAVAEHALAQHCWNRVALHHLVYREMRERFPDIGSQMVCNAIYSVSRSCRLLFQHPKSPLLALVSAQKPLPRIQFMPGAPVYFDRHTLSLRNGVLSLYTLEGRIKFRLTLGENQEALFAQEKLREVSLTEQGGVFRLRFQLGENAAEEGAAPPDDLPPELPEYLLIVDQPAAPDINSSPNSLAGVMAR